MSMGSSYTRKWRPGGGCQGTFTSYWYSRGKASKGKKNIPDQNHAIGMLPVQILIFDPSHWIFNEIFATVKPALKLPNHINTLWNSVG